MSFKLKKDVDGDEVLSILLGNSTESVVDEWIKLLKTDNYEEFVVSMSYLILLIYWGETYDSVHFTAGDIAELLKYACNEYAIDLTELEEDINSVVFSVNMEIPEHVREHSNSTIH
jgi:hypothetical protein